MTPGKRGLDIVVAGSALLVLWPLALLIAVVIKLTSPGPILLRQPRLGKDGVPFTLYKFRTMQVNVPIVRGRDGSAFVGAGDPRLTRIGQFLRDFTLDEIPQVLNVLKGDMSIIGPRPDLVEQLECYDNVMRRKFEAKPGMACLSLLAGRNSVPWRRRVELDIYYIDHCSLRLDAEIFLKGCVSILQRDGVYYSMDQTEIPASSASLSTTSANQP
jgi:lipopolysaccharide/colanic/teichoic acid biosynthesis glycosyltransferase